MHALLVLSPFIILIILLLIRVPVGFALIIASIIEFTITGNTFYYKLIPQILYSSMDKYTLLAIPFFIMTAEFLIGGEIVELLFRLAAAFLGKLPGGVGIVSIAATMLFAGIQGSSAADAAAIGRIGTEGMKEEGYDDGFAASLIATSGTLAIMIPPSIAMIIYGSISQTSIGALFYAGIVPGIIAGLILMIYTGIVSHKRGYGKIQETFTNRDRWNLFKKSLGVLALPIIVLYGFYTGKLTPTEIGTATAVYSLFIGLYLYRTITWRDVPKILLRTMYTTVTIFIIIAGAILFSKVLTQIKIPFLLFQFVKTHHLKAWEFLIFVSIVLYFLGMFMEGVALNVMTTPILVPIAVALGIDPVHYGIVLIFNIELALISPPVGLNLFVLSAATDVPLEKLYRNIWPFVLILIANLLFIIFFPKVCLFLPHIVLK